MAHLAFYPCLLLLSTTLLLLNGCCAEVFTSSSDVASMFRLEQQVVNVLTDFLSRTESKLEVIRRYLKDYESVVEEKAVNDEEFIERVVGNPIHCYRLMKRLYFDLQTIEKEIISVEWKNLLELLEKLRIMGDGFPKEEDFFGAIQAIIRLQDTYELNMTQLTRGNILGKQTKAALTAQDCFIIGQAAFNAGVYARAVEWLEQSYILSGKENIKTVRQEQVMDLIQHAVNMHDDVLKTNNSFLPVELVLFRHYLKDRPAVDQRKEIIRLGKYTLRTINDTDLFVNDQHNFNALCRGERLLSNAVASKLNCWYDDRNQPYFRLMPIRMEQQSFDPAIYTFHNILSDKEIDALKVLAEPLLARSRTSGGDHIKNEGLTQSGQNVAIDIRISKSAWLSDSMDPLLSHLSNRIRLITGLVTDQSNGGAESLQIANYGIGGHYYPHHDFLGETGEDRIATFMFYLNKVERGGATAFPRAGVAIRPTKGSAAFWYNLKLSGKPDTMTLHGACPVLLGHKWVGNKWIREPCQTFHRPCSLDANE